MKRKLLALVFAATLFTGLASAGVKVQDGFEDGTFSDIWTEQEGTSATVQSTNVQFGSNAIEISGNDNRLRHDRGTGSDTISDGDIYRAWMRTESNSNYGLYYQLGNGGGANVYNTEDHIAIRMDNAGQWKFYSRTSNGGSTADETTFGSIDTNTWYNVSIKITPSQSQSTVTITWANGTVAHQKTIATSGATDLQYVWIASRNSLTHQYDNVSYSTTDRSFGGGGGGNSAPTVDGTTHFPKPAKLGDSVNYSANASDADGDDLNAWISVYWWNNGTNIVANTSMSEPKTNEFEINELVTVQEKNNGFNATVWVSDGTTNTTAEENFYVPNTAPTIDEIYIDPYFADATDKMDVYMNASDSDGDALTGTVSVWKDGSRINNSASLTEYTTGQFRLEPVLTAGQKNSSYTFEFEVTDGSTPKKQNLTRLTSSYNPPTVDTPKTNKSPLNVGTVGRIYVNVTDIDGKDYSYENGPSPGKTTLQFLGAVPADTGDIIQVPYESGNVGIVNPLTKTYKDGASISGAGTDDRYWDGVSLDDGTIVFAPWKADNVGEYDPFSDTFSATAAHGEGDLAFAGAAQVSSGIVVFAPRASSNVGRYNPDNNSYKSGVAHGITVGNGVFFDAITANNGKVVMCPYHSEYVGVYNASTNSLTNLAHGFGRVDGGWEGCAEAPDGDIVIFPHSSDTVIRYDPDTNSLSNGTTTGEGSGNQIAFGLANTPTADQLAAPTDVSKYFIYDTVADNVDSRSVSVTTPDAFQGAGSASNALSVFAPGNNAEVGLVTPPSNVVSSPRIDLTAPNGTVMKSNVDMSNSTRFFQEFYYDVTLSTTGDWQANITGNDTTGLEDSNGTFFTVDVENTPPTTSDNWTANGWVSQDQATVKLTCSDSEGSCSSTSYRTGGSGSWTTGSPPVNVVISGEGNHTLEYNSTDSAGNTEAVQTEYVALDTGKPAITLQSDSTTGTVFHKWIFINVSVTDSTSSVASITQKFDGTNSSFANSGGQFRWENHTNLKTGSHTYRAYTKDDAGNTNSISQETVQINNQTTQVFINDSVIINQSSNNAEINITQGFNLSYFNLYNDRTDFGGTNFTGNSSTGALVDIRMSWFNGSAGVDEYVTNFTAKTSDGNNATFRFENLASSTIYNALKSGSILKQIQTGGSGIFTFFEDSWTSSFTQFNVRRTDNFLPEFNKTLIREDKKADVTRLEFEIDNKGDADIKSETGTGTLSTFTNTTLKYDITFPVSDTYKVTDFPGDSASQSIDLSETDSNLREDDFDHFLEVQQTNRSIKITNSDASSIEYNITFANHGTSQTSESFSGTITGNGNVEKTGVWQSDYLNNQTFDFTPDTSEVTLGANYIGSRALDIENTVAVTFSSVNTTQGVFPPTKCDQTNNTGVDVSASARTNYSIEFSCNPGNKGNPTQKIINLSSDKERVWYNSTDMVIHSNETEQITVAIKADEDNLKNPNERDGGSLVAYVSGNKSSGTPHLNVTDTGDFLRIEAGPSMQKSSLHTTDTDWSIGYTLSGDSTIIQTGGGGGGGGGDTGGGDLAITFDSTQHTVPFSTRSRKEFEVTNSEPTENTVTIRKGTEPFCQYVEVQKTLTSNEYGGVGTYQMPSSTTSGSNQFVFVRYDLTEVANQTQLERQGITTPECSFSATPTTGSAEELVFTPRLGQSLWDQLLQLLDDLFGRGFSSVCVPDLQNQTLEQGVNQSRNFTETGECRGSEVGGEVVAGVFAGFGLLIVVAVGNRWRKRR